MMGTQLEVGMKFTSSAAGQITALKFYRSASDTGPDVLDLWSSTGTKLASATFTNTAASGWQTVTLATPVDITAGTTYIASYHTTGAYVATDNFFTAAVTSGPLTAPSSTTSPAAMASMPMAEPPPPASSPPTPSPPPITSLMWCSGPSSRPKIEEVWGW